MNVSDGTILTDLEYDGSIRGYNFIKWNYDFNEPITKPTDIYAQLEAIEYNVKSSYFILAISIGVL